MNGCSRSTNGVEGAHEVQALPELVLVVWLELFAEVHDPVANLARRVQVADEHGAVDVPVHPVPPGFVLEQVNVLPEGHVGGGVQLVPPGSGAQLSRAEIAVDAPAYAAFDLTELEEWRGEIAELLAESAVVTMPQMRSASSRTKMKPASQMLGIWLSSSSSACTTGWVRQWHAEVDDRFGASPAEAYDAYLTAKCESCNFSEEDLRNWKPPPSTRGRRKS
jgi:hypothetical protein